MHHVLHFDVHVIATILNVIIGISYMGITFVLVPGVRLGELIGSPRAIFALKVFMSIFLLGCGLHHLHLAYFMIFDQVAISQTHGSAIGFNVMQAIGAPAALATAYLIRVAINMKADAARTEMQTTAQDTNRVVHEIHDEVKGTDE